MTGYQTSDEMSGVASKIKGQVQPISDQADAVAKSQVGASDAGRVFQDKGTAYVNALHNNVIASIRAYSTSTSTLGDRLSDTYRQYSQTEGQNTSTVRKAGH